MKQSLLALTVCPACKRTPSVARPSAGHAEDPGAACAPAARFVVSSPLLGGVPTETCTLAFLRPRTLREAWRHQQSVRLAPGRKTYTSRPLTLASLTSIVRSYGIFDFLVDECCMYETKGTYLNNCTYSGCLLG